MVITHTCTLFVLYAVNKDSVADNLSTEQPAVPACLLEWETMQLTVQRALNSMQ